MNPGSIVRCRNRDWVLLPSDSSDILRLRPLTGASDEVVAIHKRLADLIGYQLPHERIESATFPLPTSEDVSDATSAHLLWQAARLTLREGATPFRSLGRISVRPRIYQFVPLLMALRLDPVRLLIADDVGVGKTIEALLIARELWERGEIRRVCVLCPPYLCDKWQKELLDKFNLEAVIIRSGTINQLDSRSGKPRSESVYKYYPIQVASIDFLKSDRNKHLFLLDCPELIIVDEAHNATVAAENNQVRQQRHQLVTEIARKTDRHLILLTATPHSGIESSFRSLLGLLQPEFGGWDTSALKEPQRIELARHFVQRTRADIKNDWDGEHCFPTRVPSDEIYHLSPAYHDLFEKTLKFCTEIVRSGEALGARQRRVRYWGALALLRCVMSSPAAAEAALDTRQKALPDSEDEPNYRSNSFESSQDRTDDEQPTPLIESAEATMGDSDRRRLRELKNLAISIRNSQRDTKLSGCISLVAQLLREGYHPIVWCRFIATSDYVAEGIRDTLQNSFPDLRVSSITSRSGDEEERMALLKELEAADQRILVATDCLSEGIDLQEKFNAVIHYDLPWNPNRLEQREGRVDRFGQKSPEVKTIRYFSPDSAIDGIVIEVLLNKAREIHRSLGTHVPVPEESDSVTEAVLNALFMRRGKTISDQTSLELDVEVPAVKALHHRWDLDVEREKINRSRYAQRALKPGEVRQELESTDAVLGDPQAVRDFILNAAQRLGLTITPDRRRPEVFIMSVSENALATLPDAIKFVLPRPRNGKWSINFVSPTPEGAEYLGRNHQFVSSLARYLLEEALTKGAAAIASRCGVIRTRAVTRLTTILMLRIRYLMNQPGRPTLLSEEILVTGFTNDAPNDQIWCTNAESMRLLAEAQPGANIPITEKRELIAAALDKWSVLDLPLTERIKTRATDLKGSHARIRKAVDLRVKGFDIKPQLPPDLLGILVLQPLV